MIMMDLNKIRSMKALEAIREPLKEFLDFNRADMVSAYELDFGWGVEDYEADKEEAQYMLEQVEKRMKSLGHHLAKGKSSKQPDAQPVAVS
jgi:hypothetical protein